MSNEIHLHEIHLNVDDVREGAKNEEVKSAGDTVSINSQSTTLSLSQQHILNEIEAAKYYFNNIYSQEAQMRTRLKMVPEILLQNKNFIDYYKPKEISIGPVYAKSDALFKKELKVKLTAKFSRFFLGNTELLFNAIKTNIEDLIEHFGEKMLSVDMSNDELSELLFLDGCSMLQFMISYMTDELREFNISNGQAALIKQDLFLLDNQIPFQVLMLLTDEPDFQEAILKILLYFVMTSNILATKNFYDAYTPVKEFLLKNKPVHLLDLMRSMLIFGIDFPTKNRHLDRMNTNLNFLEKRLNESSQTRSFRNVSELKLAGVKLKPGESHKLEISFSTHFFIIGHLKLPKLIVDDTTTGKLLNLVAYEMSLDDYDTNCQVTNYVNFMDLLIDTEQDVKELRAAHVICNRLSSDAEVAQLFNALGSSCLAPPKDTYLNVKNEIQKHYDRKSAIWMAQVYNDHFRSPWTVLALFAAAVILFLTATQTWYAVNPKQ